MKTLAKLLLFGILTAGCAPEAERPAEAELLSSTAPLNFHVLSNCPSAVTDIEISVEIDSILTPSEVTFRDFGFPMTTLVLGRHDPIVGDVSGVERTCANPRSTEGSHTHHVSNSMTYTCTENGIEVCQIQVALVTAGEHEH